MREDADGVEPDTVTEVFQKGYKAVSYTHLEMNLWYRRISAGYLPDGSCRATAVTDSEALQAHLRLSLIHIFSYGIGISPAAAAAIILLDYIIAFIVLGLGGIFRKLFRSQGGALAAGTLLACLLRYVCHVISGCTVWAGLSIPSQDALLYSLAYNACLLYTSRCV